MHAHSRSGAGGSLAIEADGKLKEHCGTCEGIVRMGAEHREVDSEDVRRLYSIHK